MSVIGVDEVLRRITEERLIEGLGQRELHTPEGVGLDLRLDEVHRITQGGAFIEADDEVSLGLRNGVKTETCGKWVAHGDNTFIAFKPGAYYLV